MARYIDEKDVYKLIEPSGVARVHCLQIDELPRADVAPKSEVAKEALLELKKQVHDKAVYTNSQDIPNYVNLKVFDVVLNNVIKKYTESGESV